MTPTAAHVPDPDELADGLAGVPVIPEGTRVLGVVTFVLHTTAAGGEEIAHAAVTAAGKPLPLLTALGLVVEGVARLREGQE